MLKSWWREAATLILASFCWGAVLAAQARADEQIDVGPAPVLNVQQMTGTVTVQTWDRQQVQVVTDGQVNVEHLDAANTEPMLPKQINIPPQTIQTPNGPVSLGPEPFVLPPLEGAQHDAVVARGNGNTTITIPRGTALVIARIGRGRLSLNDYHGVFVAHVRNGGILMNHVDGSGFAETLRGPVIATDSNFDRLRVRTAMGNMLFNGCTSRQIEANSQYGSIVYDNGKFQPGLARFESEHGNVALGVQGGAQIGAHSDSGHVVSSFHTDAQAQTHGDANTTQTTLRGGGPVVTAASKDGSVYLYNGTVRDHPEVQAQLRGTARLPDEMPAARPVPAFGRMRNAPHSFNVQQRPVNMQQRPVNMQRPVNEQRPVSAPRPENMPHHINAQREFNPPLARPAGAPPRQAPPPRGGDRAAKPAGRPGKPPRG